MNEGDNAQTVTGDIDDPPFIPIAEIIERWKESSHFMGKIESIFIKDLIHIFQGLPMIGIGLGRIEERALGNDVHG